MSTLEIAEPILWQRYQSLGDHDARDRLFLRYAPWATSIGRSVHRRVRAYQVDRDDFVQNATIGLLDAMSRFDPGRGVPFCSYAQPRVRGAVFNGLRVILGDRPSRSDEVRFAARLHSLEGENTEGDSFSRMVESIVGLGIGYLLDEAGGSFPVDDTESYAQTCELESLLVAAVSRLPDRLKLIIHAHYFQHIPFRDLAAQLQLTKGRISQLHKSALLALRESLYDLR